MAAHCDRALQCAALRAVARRYAGRRPADASDRLFGFGRDLSVELILLDDVDLAWFL